MKFFGKKENGEQPMEEPETQMSEEDAGDGPAAPSRDAPATGSRKSSLVLFGLILIAVAGGGYFYLTGMASDTLMGYINASASPAAQTTPAPVSPADAAVAAAAADPLAVTSSTDFAVEAPAMPDVSAMTTTDAPPGDAPAMPMPEVVADSAVVPVDAAGIPLPPVPAETVPAVPAEAVSVDPAVAVVPVQEQVPPPAPDAGMPVPTVPADPAAPSPATEATPPTAVTPVADPAATGAAETLPAAPVTAATPAESTPPEDLPMPSVETPAVIKAAEPAAAATPAATPAAATPSEAELAIVQNAPVLDQMASPGTATAPSATGAPVSDLSGMDAMIRPLPKEYLIVRKDHAGGDVDSRLTSARLALTQGRYQASLQLFNELYEEWPKDKRIVMGRAVTQQRLNMYGDALASYEEVLNIDPKNIEALTNMLGLLKVQDPELAVEKLQELREAYPFNADITAQLGLAHASVGRYDEAMKYLDMAEALKPGNAYIVYNRAVLFDKMGKSTEAADLYRQIIRMSAEGSLDQPLPIETIKNRLATMH